MKVCTFNCMQDAKSTCCFVPDEVAPLFPCYRAMGWAPECVGRIDFPRKRMTSYFLLK
jgi:hypothetical protein